MGALARSRKRVDECLSSNCAQEASPFSPNFHISKRAKFSSPKQSPTPPKPSSNSAVARVSRYPALKLPLPRIHAPCKPEKFSSCGSSRGGVYEQGQQSGDAMGNVFDIVPRYIRAKYEALRTFQGRRKDKEVIELDEEEEEENNQVSKESSSEEIVVLEEDGTDESDQRSREIRVQELETKMVRGEAQATQPPSASSVASDLTTLTMTTTSKVESAEMLGLLSLLNPEGVDLPSYKKLIKAVERRTPKLKHLDFQIEVGESRRAHYESLRPKKKPVEEAPLEPFIPLKEEERAVVEQAFSSANRRKVLVTHEYANIQITGEHLQCLRPRAWLNDEVINVYLELLKEREKRDPQKFLKCHFFNTFFYKKLIGGRSGYDYKAVRRWTTQKKLGYSLIDCDKIFVPIHKEIHWCLAVINKKDQMFQYLDSLRGYDTKVMQLLAKYYVDEVKEKSGKDIDVSSWKFECVEDLPEQENGFDCGVFMIKYADFYSRGLELCFHQKHMPYFRLRTAKEVLQLRAD